jgi:glutamyl-tRNA synthetase
MARLGSSQPVELRMDLDTLAEGFDLSQFGAAPTKFDPEDLWPLTRHSHQHRPFAEVAGRLRDIGVPDAVAPEFWAVASHNITKLDELGQWWALCRDGAEPIVADEDRDFVRQALAMLPARPFTKATWSEWTETVKSATGRKGKALFRPLRLALTGRESGPEMADLLPLLQKLPNL